RDVTAYTEVPGRGGRSGVRVRHRGVIETSRKDAVKIMAKDLVRTRRYVKKFITMRANVQAVSLKIQTLKSNNSMAQAMKGVTKAMATMNRQVGDIGTGILLSPPSDAVVSQVLDELGLNLTDELATLPPPGGSLAAGEGRAAEAAAALADADADLEERLKNLRRD
ncbi:charged multivesicular body protein 2a, partial [Coturnix japonica]|uniref:charged multivesicular body protein 2a n=1 Tax=Coturnix japonica TaxID=93934 RepID=UPI0013A5C422